MRWHWFLAGTRSCMGLTEDLKSNDFVVCMIWKSFWIAHVKQRKEGSSILRSAVVKAYKIAWNLKQICHSRTTTGEKILKLSTPISMASCTQQCETLVTLPLDKGFSGSNLAEVVSQSHKVSATSVSSPRPWLWEHSPALYRRRARPESDERWTHRSTV